MVWVRGWDKGKTFRLTSGVSWDCVMCEVRVELCMVLACYYIDISTSKKSKMYLLLFK